MTKPLVLYHGGCSDGFCAAWLCHRHYGPGFCDFVPVNYGEPPPDVAGREVFVLDFSYKRPVLEEMARKATRVVVLDHHASAERELFGLQADNLAVTFDMQKSGARLTWEFLNQKGRMEPAPWLVPWTEDRDLWRFHLYESKAINAVIRSHPMTFDAWDELYRRLPDRQMATEGQAILRAQDRQIEVLVRHAREVEMAGNGGPYKVLVVNTPLLQSEVAGKLAEGRPFGACWYEAADGTRRWSLRSTEQGIDVSRFAQSRGGGGHPRAAGFEEKG